MMSFGLYSRFSPHSPSGTGGVEKNQRNKALMAVALFVCLLIGLAMVNPTAHAQEVTGTIVGTVVDSSGAALNQATVTAKDVNRGTVWTAKTNESGAFRIERVPVGRYEVKAEAQGFRAAMNPAFDLVLSQIARLNFEMKVGAITETVEVTGAAPLLQTDSTEIGRDIDSLSTEHIPLITRNYGQLTLLTPGAVSTNPPALTSGQSTFKVA